MSDREFEGDPIKTEAMPERLKGQWKGYWKSDLDRLNEDLILNISAADNNKFTGSGRAAEVHCAGDGFFTAKGQMLPDGVQFLFTFEYPGCGDVRTTYTMKKSAEGKMLMKGKYFETMKGDTGHHFLVRE